MISRKNSLISQPWIRSAPFDTALILGPSVIAVIIVLVFHKQFALHHAVGPLIWLGLVVCIDVAHVYASLFRTYFDSTMREQNILWVIPLLCWMFGTLLYSLSPRFFWTGLAYLAVFHFVRQQYGFAMIYARGENSLPRFFKTIDRITIYAATLYPLVFWHTHLPRNFSWFVDGDFIGTSAPLISEFAGFAYLVILVLYFAKEIWTFLRLRRFNIPKNLVVIGTAASWYLGIVWLNNDLAFTLTNVVSHGIPYVALVWLYGHNQTMSRTQKLRLFSFQMIPVFIASLILLAYLEEGLWDGFIWRDHTRLFQSFSDLPVVEDKLLLAFLVPLLALPQSTHYAFDAFLWRVSGKNSGWKNIIFKNTEQSK